MSNEVSLIKTVDCGDSGLGKMVGLYFSVNGKELFYSLSDSMLYDIIVSHMKKCVMPGSPSDIPQTQ